MRLRFTKRYLGLCRKLPVNVRNLTDKKLKILLDNPQHLSLWFHKLESHRNLWEISITMHYRVLLQIQGDEYVLLKIGPHRILDRP